ncbi:MAG: glycosyltransferase family 9 protein [Prochlorotrichaceae cyanobacterium]
MHILALVPGGIGNQILFFPTLETLKQTYPEAAIDVITEPSTVGIYRIYPQVRRAIPFDFSDRNSLADWSNLLGVIREQEYEIVLSAQPGWDIGLLLWLSGIPNRVGYAQSGNLFLSAAIAEPSTPYRAERYHALTQGLGLTTPCPTPRLRIPRKDLEWGEAEQKRLGATESGYLLLYPQDDPDPYPAQNWQILVKKLQEHQPDLPVWVVQTTTGREVMAQLNQAGLSCGAVSPEQIGQLVALIAGASLLICPEGDVLQLAVAVQTSTLALLGRSNPDQVLPPGDTFISLQSSTGRLVDITPQQILETIFEQR